MLFFFLSVCHKFNPLKEFYWLIKEKNFKINEKKVDEKKKLSDCTGTGGQISTENKKWAKDNFPH